MNNLATFTVCVFAAYAAFAQQSPVNWPHYTPFFSYSYNFNNPDVLPNQQNAPVLMPQNSNQYSILHRDAMLSAMLRELKETKVVVENVKKEMVDMKNELAQLKHSAEEESEAEHLQKNRNKTKSQSEMLLPIELEPLTFNSSKNGEIPTAKGCNCALVLYIIGGLTNELKDMKFKLDDLSAQVKANSDPTTIGIQPSSCADLKQLGYKKSGLFSVMGTNQVESVYCDFTKSSSSTDFQKLIGVVDVKSTRVYFHAKRSSSYSTPSTAVPFEMLETNVGNAMTISTGIVTAPTTGMYFFSYSGVGNDPNYSDDTQIQLQMKNATGNWLHIGTSLSTMNHYGSFVHHATLFLRKNDEVRLFLLKGEIYDTAATQFTNFVGFLLEQELV